MHTHIQRSRIDQEDEGVAAPSLLSAPRRRRVRPPIVPNLFLKQRLLLVRHQHQVGARVSRAQQRESFARRRLVDVLRLLPLHFSLAVLEPHRAHAAGACTAAVGQVQGSGVGGVEQEGIGPALDCLLGAVVGVLEGDGVVDAGRRGALVAGRRQRVRRLALAGEAGGGGRGGALGGKEEGLRSVWGVV